MICHNLAGNMSKPILVTRFPSFIHKEYLGKVDTYYTHNISDYNHIILRDSSVERIEFEVFNVQDYPAIDFNELKSKLELLNEPDKTSYRKER